ncbi:hypothetical protein ACFSS9_15965 [Paenibacillus septentrionalis]|uniref:hypothetical protein n=1 Tax=Paenibacillus septentrionalis TaxID=429342 RepID=UPI003641E57F
MEEQEIEKEEPIYKQIWNSLKEIGNDAIAASNDRWDRQFDSVYDFVNYWSGGLTGAVWEGAQERTNKWDDSVYDFFELSVNRGPRHDQGNGRQYRRGALSRGGVVKRACE